MRLFPKLALALVLIAGLGAAGYEYHCQQARRQALLARFGQLDAAVQVATRRATRRTASNLYGIEVAVSRLGRQPKDLHLLAESRQVQARTQALTDSLHLLRQLLLAQVPDAAGVQAFMHSGSPSSRAARLQQQLDAYVAYIKTYVPEAPSLTGPSQRHRKLPHYAANEWFADFYFTGVPSPAAAATFTSLAAQVATLGEIGLQKQALKTGCYCDYFEKVAPYAVPKSSLVTPGAIYEADLLLTTSTQPYPLLQMSANGHRLVLSNGQGLVSMLVPPAQPGQPDTVQAQWQGTAWLRPDGEDAALHLTVPYFIVRRN